jgi:hypothetical protein
MNGGVFKLLMSLLAGTVKRQHSGTHPAGEYRHDIFLYCARGECSMEFRQYYLQYPGTWYQNRYQKTSTFAFKEIV